MAKGTIYRERAVTVSSRNHEYHDPIDLTRVGPQKIAITESLAKRYSLDEWASEFWLMTAGYRDRLDPDDAQNPAVPFNLLTVAIMVEAKARVFKRLLLLGEVGDVHIAGEVRPHTDQFIELAARIYAAHGFRVHLRKGVRTTPIWYSSFGVFYLKLQSGDNFTASHSACFKGGWKPMDSKGQQLLKQEEEIVSELRSIVKNRETIALAPTGDRVARDFDIDEAYLAYQRSLLGNVLVEEILNAGAAGFRLALCPLGGAMGQTARRLFSGLGMADQMVEYVFAEESSEYHRLGHVGDTIEGVDPCDPQIYRNVGLQKLLANGGIDVAFVTDPDGDRVKVVSTGPAGFAERAKTLGVEVEEVPGSDRCIVYLTPNQMYLVIVAFRIQALKESGDLDRYDWLVAKTFPTTKALEEIATSEGLKTVQVPVGFKYLGALSRALEEQLGSGSASFRMATGEIVQLGKNPRIIILCEESGGSALGGKALLTDRDGGQGMLSLREKDGMQIILFAIALGARLHRQGKSLLEYFCEVVDQYGIRHLHYKRFDVKLYDEGLSGEALRAAKDEGIRRRDAIVGFFSSLVRKVEKNQASLADLHAEFCARATDKSYAFPALTRAASTGDGTLFEFDGARFLLRSSGTEALVRYYVEGADMDTVETLGRSLIDLRIETDGSS